MRNHRSISGKRHIVQQLVQVIWRRKIRRLYQHTIPIQRLHSLFKPLLETGIQHIFSPQLERDFSGITPAQRIESLQHILPMLHAVHHMRRQPHLLHPERIEVRQHLQRLLYRLYAVVHPRKDMAVAIHKAPKKAGIRQPLFMP